MPLSCASCASTSAGMPRPRPGEPDELRELTAEGVEQARALGARLAALPEPPRLVLTSPLLRARQTGAEIATETGVDGARRGGARARRDGSGARSQALAGRAAGRSRRSATSPTAPRSRSRCSAATRAFRSRAWPSWSSTA